MKLSLFSDYSLRVLIFAALKGDSFQIEEVTVAYGISRHHLAKIVQSLSKLGYLDTRRGRGGGIQ
ncbi:MAG: Rrf2 family transcriptional regulator, partial [Prosthecobacter sp.]|nr:Rrf2 family transcriptional regulator [Prosthecobacter sp.]